LAESAASDGVGKKGKRRTCAAFLLNSWLLNVQQPVQLPVYVGVHEVNEPVTGAVIEDTV
jgi:hypothetical protein